MKKILFTILACLISSIVSAQDRVDEKPIALTYKSKEIKDALYWYQENGKWKSRSNTSKPLVSGVQNDNFTSMFLGEVDSLKFLFIDYYQGEYLYPNLEMNWGLYRKIHGTPLSKDDFDNLKNIQQGNVVNIKSRYSVSTYKGNSFTTFLGILIQMHKTNILLHEAQILLYGEEAANKLLENENPLKCILSVKRTTSNNKDVVRFNMFPVFIDIEDATFKDCNYFELDYSDYLLLFEADKKVKYKF